ncbi:hypothetical protein NDU88_007031 [Pleurodeles waltl]|uniref:Uncharacterized protein n=1 Tax=Pleurodeles waltl TaxID=8319 RepID=A0AAV7UMR5_PLEWA|nr:hypothetical protein NDU88_007031 [Pleurodeles waltl]
MGPVASLDVACGSDNAVQPPTVSPALCSRQRRKDNTWGVRGWRHTHTLLPSNCNKKPRSCSLEVRGPGSEWIIAGGISHELYPSTTIHLLDLCGVMSRRQEDRSRDLEKQVDYCAKAGQQTLLKTTQEVYETADGEEDGEPGTFVLRNVESAVKFGRHFY